MIAFRIPHSAKCEQLWYWYLSVYKNDSIPHSAFRIPQNVNSFGIGIYQYIKKATAAEIDHL